MFLCMCIYERESVCVCKSFGIVGCLWVCYRRVHSKNSLINESSYIATKKKKKKKKSVCVYVFMYIQLLLLLRIEEGAIE